MICRRRREPEPILDRGPEWLDLSDYGAVIIAGGFRPGYRSWAPWPEAFDDLGFPLQREGVSTVVPGLFFVGVHFQRTRKSSLLFGVGEDATIVSRHVGAFLCDRRAPGMIFSKRVCAASLLLAPWRD